MKYGANIDAQTTGGDTALIKATEMGHHQIEKELMLWNCDFRIKNKVIFYNNIPNSKEKPLKTSHKHMELPDYLLLHLKMPSNGLAAKCF